mmetsp:Transcript_5438/g.13123  ORF Transcript_5438/g.13123 Transcript_5438/m.13123 type:complete len:235 (-) Transcript_5438:142-846(-)
MAGGGAGQVCARADAEAARRQGQEGEGEGRGHGGGGGAGGQARAAEASGRQRARGREPRQGDAADQGVAEQRVQGALRPPHRRGRQASRGGVSQCLLGRKGPDRGEARGRRAAARQRPGPGGGLGGDGGCGRRSSVGVQVPSGVSEGGQGGGDDGEAAQGVPGGGGRADEGAGGPGGLPGKGQAGSGQKEGRDAADARPLHHRADEGVERARLSEQDHTRQTGRDGDVLQQRQH